MGTYQLKVRSQADTEADFSGIIIRQTDDGGTSSALVTWPRWWTVSKTNPILATLNGEPAVLLQVMTTETMDIIRASESIRVTGSTSARRPCRPGAELTLWTDQAEDFEGPHGDHRQLRQRLGLLLVHVACSC